MKKIMLAAALIFSCGNTQAFDTESFLEMTREQQAYYVFGIIDREVMEARFGPDYGECVMKWARGDMFEYLGKWYEENDALVGQVALTFVIHMRLRKLCQPNSGQ